MARMRLKLTPGAQPVSDAQDRSLRALFADSPLADEDTQRSFHESSWSLRSGLDVFEMDLDVDTVPMVLDAAADRGSVEF